MSCSQEEYEKMMAFFNEYGSKPPKKQYRISFEFDPHFWQTPCIAYNNHCKEIELQVLCFGVTIYIGNDGIKRRWSFKNLIYR